MSDDADFGFPSAPCRGRKTLFAVEAIVKPLGASPLPPTSGTAQRASRLDGIFDILGRLHHQVEHGVLGTDHTEPFKFAARIDTHDERLIVRFLLLGELDVEQAQFVSLWPRLAILEQMAGFSGCTGHQSHPACIHDWYSQGISLLQVKPG